MILIDIQDNFSSKSLQYFKWESPLNDLHIFWRQDLVQDQMQSIQIAAIPLNGRYLNEITIHIDVITRYFFAPNNTIQIWIENANDVEWMAREAGSLFYFYPECKTTERLMEIERKNQFSCYYSIDIIISDGVHDIFISAFAPATLSRAANKKAKMKNYYRSLIACIELRLNCIRVERNARGNRRTTKNPKTKLLKMNRMKNEMSRRLLQFTIPSRLNGDWMLKIIMNGWPQFFLSTLNLFFVHISFERRSFSFATEILYKNFENRTLNRRLCNHRVAVEQLINIVSRCIQNI